MVAMICSSYANVDMDILMTTALSSGCPLELRQLLSINHGNVHTMRLSPPTSARCTATVDLMLMIGG